MRKDVFPGGTRVRGLRAPHKRQTAPVKRKTDKYDVFSPSRVECRE